VDRTFTSDEAPGSGRNQYRDNRTAIAFPVVALQITRIRGGLINIRLGGMKFALQLDYEKATAHKQYCICTA
jgi:hypothetical protein